MAEAPELSDSVLKMSAEYIEEDLMLTYLTAIPNEHVAWHSVPPQSKGCRPLCSTHRDLYDPLHYDSHLLLGSSTTIPRSQGNRIHVDQRIYLRPSQQQTTAVVSASQPGQEAARRHALRRQPTPATLSDAQQ